MSIGLLGQKIGMTSVYDAKGRLRPVTVIAAGDNVLLRRLTEENEGYRRCRLDSAHRRNRALGNHCLGNARSPGRWARDCAESSGYAGARTGKDDFSQRRGAWSERQLRDRSAGD